MGALAAAVLLGAAVAPFWQSRPAVAETIREFSWYLAAMHVEEAHRIATGKGVTVAVVDTGVDAGHPDLQGQVLEGKDLSDGVGKGVDTKGQKDQDGHGTGMASLIAGAGERGENSVLGVAPDAEILPVRIAQNSDGAFRPEDVYQGVRWAIDHGADVVNISLGGERSSDGPWKEQLVNYAMENDVVLVAAAGNIGQGDKQVAEPASIPGVVAVSGLARDGTFWTGSATGPEVVVSAPAEELPHAVPMSVSESGYALADGTSGATALVSGVSALIRQAFPDAGVNDVVNRLIHTAEDRGDSGRDEEYGYGAVDARAALEGEVPNVKHHPLVSPEAAKSDAAAAGAQPDDNRIALIVVGGFIGLVLALLVVSYLIYLARRSRQVVVAGVIPGYPAIPMTGVTWGAPSTGVPPAMAGPVTMASPSGGAWPAPVPGGFPPQAPQPTWLPRPGAQQRLVPQSATPPFPQTPPAPPAPPAPGPRPGPPGPGGRGVTWPKPSVASSHSAPGPGEQPRAQQPALEGLSHPVERSGQDAGAVTQTLPVVPPV